MNDFDDIVQRLRLKAAAGQDATSIVGWLFEELGKGATMFSVMHRMRLAFKIPIITLRDIEDWVGFGHGGHLSDDALNELINPFMRKDM